MYSIFEQLMKSEEITPYKVAKETGITQATLSRWKTGKVSPSIETLQTLANYFGVTLDYLVGNVSDPFFHLDSERILRGINSYDDEEREEKPAAQRGNELQDVYFNFAKDAQDNGIDPKDIDAAIDMIKRLRNK